MGKKFDLKASFLKLIDSSKGLSKCLRFLVSFFFVYCLLKLVIFNDDAYKMKHIRDTREYNTKFRTIYTNNIRPEEYNEEYELLSYASNQIVTSKVKWQHFFLLWIQFIYMKSLICLFLVHFLEFSAQKFIRTISASC